MRANKLLPGTTLGMHVKEGVAILRVVQHRHGGVVLVRPPSVDEIFLPYETLEERAARGNVWRENAAPGAIRSSDDVEAFVRRQAAGRSLTPKEIEHISWLAPYIVACQAAGVPKTSRPKIEAVITQQHTKLGGKRPWWQTISNHLKRLEKADIVGLPQIFIAARGNRSARFKGFEEKINEVLRANLSGPERTSLAKLRDETLAAELAVYNAKVAEADRVKRLPNLRTLQRREAELRKEAKTGKAAQRRLRVSARLPIPARVLEVVEIDHTAANVTVVHPRTRMPIAIAVITVMIDRRSRAIVGIVVGFEPPGIGPVLRCFRNALTPKDELLRRLGLPVDQYPVYGRWETMVADGGREFHGVALEAVAAELQVDVGFTRTGEPTNKAIVESFIGTLKKQLLWRLPGSTRQQDADGKWGVRPLKEAREQACLTIEELRARIWAWVVEHYWEAKHAGLKDEILGIEKSPKEVFLEGRAGLVPDEVPDPNRLARLLTKVEDVRITKYGVVYEGLRYGDNDRLEALRRLDPDRRYLVRVNPDDLGSILLIDPHTNLPITLKCDNPEAAGLTLRELHAGRELYGKRDEDDGDAAGMPLKDAVAKIRANAHAEAGRSKGRKQVGTTGRKAALLARIDPEMPALPTAALPAPATTLDIDWDAMVVDTSMLVGDPRKILTGGMQ